MPASLLIILAQVTSSGPETGLRLALAAVLFVFVIVILLAVFSQRGRTEITPQRAAAIATGHADRDTVFEKAYLQPVMWLLLVAARRAGGPKLRKWLRETLVAAGSPNFYTPDECLAVAMLWGLLIAAGMEALNALAGGGISIVIPPVGFLIGTCGYLYNLHGKASKRVRLISRRVPYMLDLVALAMGAGATFTEAVRTVVREDPEHPFNVELNTVLAEIDLGTTRGQSLRNLADRIPLESLRSIVAAMPRCESWCRACSSCCPWF